MQRLFPKKDPRKEVEDQPHIKEAHKQIHRAQVIIELNRVEDIARGRAPRERKH